MATEKQRRLLNSLVQTIAEHTGHEFGEIKWLAKHRAIRRGYPYRLSEDDVQPYSETEITTEEAGYLIEELYQISAETGALYRENE